MIPWSMGPRMMTARSGSSRNPIDISFRPLVSIGWIRSPRAMGRPDGADQVGDRRAVDVGIHQADRGTVGTQAEGDGGGHRRLADAPFSRADGDHVLDAGDVAGLGDPLAADLGPHGDVQLPLAGQPVLQGRADVAFDLRLERAGRSRQVHRQRHGAVADPDILDHPQIDQIAAEVRVLDPLEGVEHIPLGERRIGLAEHRA